MKIYLATDHAGFSIKESIKEFIKDKFNHEVIDMGATSYNQLDDYTDFIHKASRKVADSNGCDVAIIFGGSGQGEAIAANKHIGVRAAVYYGGSLEIVRLSREHNNSNVLSIGARFVDLAQATEAVSVWLNTKFSNDQRHIRRINKIEI